MKRSTGVALVLMGAAAVGGTTYWVSARDCNNVQPGTSQAESCRSSNSAYYGGRSYYWGHQQSASNPNAYSSNASSNSHPASGPSVARSGFGSTGHGTSSGS
jgi:hypothetical protein